MKYSFFERATQGLRKKLKNCEEFVAKRQIEPDSCGSMKCLCNKRRGPTIVKRFLSQIRDSENKVNSLAEERDFHNPETANSSGASHVPTQPLTNPSTRSIRCRDSGLPPNTRNAVGTPGDVF